MGYYNDKNSMTCCKQLLFTIIKILIHFFPRETKYLIPDEFY
jgi:hypothetical protein